MLAVKKWTNQKILLFERRKRRPIGDSFKDNFLFQSLKNSNYERNTLYLIDFCGIIIYNFI